MPFIYKSHMQKFILLPLLLLFENLGSYALEYSHLKKIHHDFNIVTFRKDDTKSMSLHLWMIDSGLWDLSPQDFGMPLMTVESLSSQAMLIFSTFAHVS